MKWVDTKQELPQVGRRVLCAMYADTEWPFPACGTYSGGYWVIDDISRPVKKHEIKYWAPIARIPKEV